jgi:hypothetical protein
VREKGEAVEGMQRRRGRERKREGGSSGGLGRVVLVSASCRRFGRREGRLLLSHHEAEAGECKFRGENDEEKERCPVVEQLPARATAAMIHADPFKRVSAPVETVEADNKVNKQVNEEEGRWPNGTHQVASEFTLLLSSLDTLVRQVEAAGRRRTVSSNQTRGRRSTFLSSTAIAC